MDDQDLVAFMDLAPKTIENNDSYYLKALEFCVGRSNVYNIALSGPYGSGKSSILKTYQYHLSNSSPTKILDISLASFEVINKSVANGKPVSDEKSDNKENDSSAIERSILQQMLYRKPPEDLPFSRFKRIVSPQLTEVKAIFALLWASMLFILLNHSSSFFAVNPISVAGALALILFGSFLYSSWWLLERLITYSHNFNLKTISKTSIEFESVGAKDGSVLNRYLDEILYFLEKTGYNLIIFEDIDRFNNAEIFIKLREINTIINQVMLEKHLENGSGNTTSNFYPIQFLYAMKDTMFTDTERTKFFEFIIPVVPVVGSSNSIDIMTSYFEQLGKQVRSPELKFLKQASVFINDARLLINTINEFVIYQHHLLDDKLDPTKLVAMMLYKNVYCKDFEHLHKGYGVVFTVFSNKSLMIKEEIGSLEEQIQDSEDKLESIKNNNLHNKLELARLCLYLLTKSNINKIIRVKSWDGSQKCDCHELVDVELFFKIVSMSDSNFEYYNGGSYQSNQNWQNELGTPNRGMTPLETRIHSIENKSTESQQIIKARIESLHNAILEVKIRSLKDILQSSPDLLDQYLPLSQNQEISAQDNFAFLRFLLIDGHIDEYYYLYTSIFREAADFSRNDRNVFTSIKARQSISHTAVIDNPKELLERLDISDLKLARNLNIRILNHLLSDKTEPRLIYVIKAIIDSYTEGNGQAFASLYCKTGDHVNKFISNMVANYDEYLFHCVNGVEPTDEVVAVLRYTSYVELSKQINLDNFVTYIDTEFATLCKHPGFAISEPLNNLFSELGLEITELQAIEQVETVLEFICINGLYSLDRKNVSYLLSKEKSQRYDSKQPYTAVRTSKVQHLIDKVDSQLEAFIATIYLDNKSEEFYTDDQTYLVDLLNRVTISLETRISLIQVELVIFDSLNKIEEALWRTIIISNKVSPTKNNLLSIYKFDATLLTEFLNRTSLSMLPDNLSGEKDTFLPMWQSVVNDNGLQTDIYLSVLSAIKLSWKNFPKNVSTEKLRGLIARKLVSFNTESLASVITADNLVIEFILQNESSFVSLMPEIVNSLSVSQLEGLYSSNLSLETKVVLSGDISESLLSGSSSLQNSIAKYFLQVNNCDASVSIIVEMAKNVKDVDVAYEFFIRLLNKNELLLLFSVIEYVSTRWPKQKVLKALSTLPQPYNVLAELRARPKLPFTEGLSSLLQALKKAGIISTYEEVGDIYKVNLKYFR